MGCRRRAARMWARARVLGARVACVGAGVDPGVIRGTVLGRTAFAQIAGAARSGRVRRWRLALASTKQPIPPTNVA
jgi:hypothetical protein